MQVHLSLKSANAKTGPIIPYAFARAQQQRNVIDACCDTAAAYGIPAATLAAWIIASGVESPIANARLALI